MKEDFLLENASENVSTAVALGLFDGVHKGHRAVLKAAVDSGFEPWAFTFSDAQMPDKKRGFLRIGPADIKYGIMESCGIKHCCVVDFENVKDLSGEEFVKDILVDRLHCKFAVCGDDFRFGKRASCGIRELEEFGQKYGFKLCVVDKVKENGETICSTWMRSAAANGDMASVEKLSGYPFCLVGIVEYGKQIGRKYGFPTINIGFEDGYIIPKYGVYVSATVVGKEIYPSITNVGIKPTVTNEAKLVSETHLIDRNIDLYGKKVIVFLIEFMRDEMKFETKELLFDQVRKDCELASEKSGEWIKRSGEKSLKLLNI